MNQINEAASGYVSIRTFVKNYIEGDKERDELLNKEEHNHDDDDDRFSRRFFINIISSASFFLLQTSMNACNQTLVV